MKHIITIFKIPRFLNLLQFWYWKYKRTFHSSRGTDLGQSIAVVTDNTHAIGVVKPVYG